HHGTGAGEGPAGRRAHGRLHHRRNPLGEAHRPAAIRGSERVYRHERTPRRRSGRAAYLQPEYSPASRRNHPARARSRPQGPLSLRGGDEGRPRRTRSRRALGTCQPAASAGHVEESVARRADCAPGCSHPGCALFRVLIPVLAPLARGMARYLQRARAVLQSLFRGEPAPQPVGASTAEPAGENVVVEAGRVTFLDRSRAASDPAAWLEAFTAATLRNIP